MKAADLVNLWNAPDNSRLTTKQLSFRLPVHVAAKLPALCDLYPNKNRTERLFHHYRPRPAIEFLARLRAWQPNNNFLASSSVRPA
jgi:hypothetical protein